MLSWIRNLFINKTHKEHAKSIFSNAIDLNDLNDTLDDQWIKIVPIGVFPLHHNGAHEIKSDHIKQMADNFTSSGTDLLFDYEHRSLWGDSIAAGWSGELEAREDGLYAKYPAFTAKASKHIEDREYRYLSPVYRLDAMDKSGRDIGAVILHVGLTNTPYLDNEIDHIGNSSLLPGGKEVKTLNTDNRTDMKLSKENLAKLGLDETATEEQINQAIANSAMNTPGNTGQTQTIETETAAAETREAGGAQASEGDNERIAALEARLAKKEQEELAEKADILVNSAIEKGKILPRDKDAYLNSANANYKATKEILDKIQVNSVVPGSIKVNTDVSDGSKVNDRQAFRDYVKTKMATA